VVNPLSISIHRSGKVRFGSVRPTEAWGIGKGGSEPEGWVWIHGCGRMGIGLRPWRVWDDGWERIHLHPIGLTTWLG